MLNLTPSGIKLTPTGVKINTNLVWTSHNTGGVEFNTGVFAVYECLVHICDNIYTGFGTFLRIEGLVLRMLHT